MILPYLVGSYLVGATPTSYIAGRVVRGIDLREHGSGNLGATNVFRVLGWRAAVPVFIIDLLKGWAPTALFPLWDGAPDGWRFAYGALAIIGHVYSAYVGFRGGKGIATSTGVFIALAPLAVLGGLAVWLALVFGTRIVSVGSIGAALALPLLVWATLGAGPTLGLAAALAAFVVFAHRANVRRLLRGEEHRFGRKAKEAG